jgi:Tfp pilus tip-associated adhesin PilY1
VLGPSARATNLGDIVASDPAYLAARVSGSSFTAPKGQVTSVAIYESNNVTESAAPGIRGYMGEHHLSVPEFVRSVECAL